MRALPPLLPLLLLAPAQVEGRQGGLGRQPVLGWNTWCTGVGCGVDWCSSTEILSVAAPPGTNMVWDGVTPENGVYLEPKEIAHTEPAAITDAYLSCAKELLKREGPLSFATHDDLLIDRLVPMIESGSHQGGDAGGGLQVDAGRVLQQHEHDGKVAFARSSHERGAAEAAWQVDARASLQQLPHHLQLAVGCGGVQQGCG